jgi:hypothetical protein
MTEDDWLASQNVTPMIAYLLNEASDRKLRLFACACCMQLARSEEDRQAVDLGERFADALVSDVERRTAWNAIEVQKRDAIDMQNFQDAIALWVRGRPLAPDMNASRGLDGLARSLVGERSIDLLHCIFGNPFQPPGGPGWDDPRAIRLAQGIYEERAFERLPILADALEEAGCQDALALDHCRQNGNHVRGCWVIDLLLKKV